MRNFLQAQITCQMPQMVIIFFEEVNIDHQDADRHLIAQGDAPLLLQNFRQVPAVCQPSQRVQLGKQLSCSDCLLISS